MGGDHLEFADRVATRTTEPGHPLGLVLPGGPPVERLQQHAVEGRQQLSCLISINLHAEPTGSPDAATRLRRHPIPPYGIRPTRQIEHVRQPRPGRRPDLGSSSPPRPSKQRIAAQQDAEGRLLGQIGHDQPRLRLLQP